jgi:putative PEP-CTERM system histidine kinase
MIPVGEIGYGAAALAFVLLTVLLAVGWKGGAQGMRFIIASAVSALWALVAVWNAARQGEVPVALVFSAEMLRDGAWLAALTGVARGFLPRLLAVGTQSGCFVLLGFVWLLPLLTDDLSPDGLATLTMIPAGIAAAMVVLLLLEQIYRNSNATGRYGFKFLAIGLGGVFAFDLFLYSQGLLFRGLSEEFWQLRGFVNAALVPLIAIAARRNPQWSLDIFVSRQAVLFTTTVMAVGVYLLFMSLGGYYLRLVGGRWGLAANLLFVSGAMAVLAIVVASGTVRRRLRVFLHKHFYRNKYDYRVEWLRFVQTIASAQEQDVRRTCLRAIAQLFQSDGAILFTRSSAAPEYVPAAAWPWAPDSSPHLAPVAETHEMIGALRGRGWVIDLREYRDSPEFYQNLELPAALRELQGFRIIAPLLDADRLAGFVVLREPPPPFELTYEDRDLLQTVGRHVAAILAQQEAERRLAEGRQFEAYHRLTAFVMHDLKNLVSQLNLVVSNASRHRGNPQFVDDAFATVANAASRMAQLITQLNKGAGAAGRQEPVLIAEVLAEAVGHCSDRQPVPVLEPGPVEERPAAVLADRARLTSVLEHVIRNAQDASQPSGRIALALRPDRQEWVVEVRDQGQGMSAEFVRNRLFKPFDSTKGSKGMGIGAYQVREYVRSLGGDIEVQSSPGAGTCFAIKLPRHE